MGRWTLSYSTNRLRYLPYSVHSTAVTSLCSPWPCHLSQAGSGTYSVHSTTVTSLCSPWPCRLPIAGSGTVYTSMTSHCSPWPCHLSQAGLCTVYTSMTSLCSPWPCRLIKQDQILSSVYVHCTFVTSLCSLWPLPSPLKALQMWRHIVNYMTCVHSCDVPLFTTTPYHLLWRLWCCV